MVVVAVVVVVVVLVAVAAAYGGGHGRDCGRGQRLVVAVAVLWHYCEQKHSSSSRHWLSHQLLES